MNKSVMNAIEVLSANFNFSVDDAVSILTSNNKKSRSKAKDVQPKKEVEDLFAQLVNDSDDEASRGKTYEFDLKPVPETVIITTTTFEASDVKKPAKKEKKTVDPEKEKAKEELAVKKALKELEKEKAKQDKILKEFEKQKANEEKAAKKKLSEDKEEMKKQKLLNKDVAALEKKSAAEAAITPRTRAIMPVHLYGHPAAVDQLSELASRNNIHLVEDAAQAHPDRSVDHERQGHGGRPDRGRRGRGPEEGGRSDAAGAQKGHGRH